MPTDASANRYNVIYKQSRPLLHHPHFQTVLMKLVGDREDMEVAKIIEKTLQQQKPSPSRSSPPSNWSQDDRSPDLRYRPYSRNPVIYVLIVRAEDTMLEHALSGDPDVNMDHLNHNAPR